MTAKEAYLSAVRRRYPRLAPAGEVIERRGQFNDVLILDRALVFRFPRAAHVIAEMDLEMAVLGQIHAALPLPVPYPLYRGAENAPVGEAFTGYRFIPGVPLTPTRLAALTAGQQASAARELAGFLAALHAIPAESINTTLPVCDGRVDWERFFQQVRALLLPHMRPDARQEVNRLADTALNDPALFVFQPCLRHGDFGPTNILLDETTGQVSGVIDFSSIALGDPAVDLASLSLYGWGFIQQMGQSDSTIPSMLERVRFYRSTFALQEALAGALDGDNEAFRSGMAGYV